VRRLSSQKLIGKVDYYTKSVEVRRYPGQTDPKPLTTVFNAGLRKGPTGKKMSDRIHILKMSV